MMTTAPLQFSFESHNFVEKLRQISQEPLTGYWTFEFGVSKSTSKPWYIALSQGKVVFSGAHRLSWSPFVAVLQQYITRLRAEAGKQAIQSLESSLTPDQLGRLGNMLGRLEKMNVLSYDEAVQAIRLKVLADFDAYISSHQGQATFIEDFQVVAQSPVLGFDLDNLITEASQRQLLWQQMRQYVPSINAVPQLDAQKLAESAFGGPQKQQLQKITSAGRTLGQIAEGLGKDPLEVAKTFSGLVRSGVISFPPSAQSQSAEAPCVFIVDDSPVLIKQFRQLVSKWGYQVEASEDALTSIEKLLLIKPKIVFLDINMPGATGFELIKKIRRQPELADIPLVLLTAEKSVSNQWRAQWANCKFLAKPSKPEEQATFRTDLLALLQEVAPLPQDR